MNLGDGYKDLALDLLFGDTTPSIPATLYVALYTAAPTSAGGGTEVTGGSYARVAVSNDVSNFPDASGGSKHNGNSITFPTATGDWGTVTNWAYHTDPTADQIYVWGDIGTPVDVPNGDTAQFAATVLVTTSS